MSRTFKLLITLAVALLSVLSANAISGHFTDPGGGTYWCNVYVSSISSGKSYGWCTGDSEDAKMNEFRHFETNNGGDVSTKEPTVWLKFCYNRKQSKDYDYKSSEQDIYVVLKNGQKYQIVEGRSNWNQTNYSWGRADCSWDGTYFYCRFAPNERGMREVAAIQVESRSYFYQSNFWHSDYWFYITARYLKDINFNNMSRAREPQIDWPSPDKVKVSTDNSWLPEEIGKNVSNFKFATVYDVTVTDRNGNNFSKDSFKAEGRGTGEKVLAVPTNGDFKVNVTRHTETNFTFNGTNISQNLNENTTTTMSCPTTITNLTATYNQVEDNVSLQWNANGISSGDGDFQICRTQLDENYRPTGNREELGSTGGTTFTDNANYGMEMSRNYRYEVFQKRNSWESFDVPSNPQKNIPANTATVFKSTVPVIPMHLVQDTTATDKVKVEWTFGNVPKNENDLTFKVHRIEPGGSVTRNYTEVNVSRDAGKASFSDEKPASACSLYGYFVQLDLADNKVHLYSDTIYAHVLGVSAVTSVDATKGTAGTEVVIRWKARQVGTKPTLYNVQRRYIGSNDWISIHEEEDTKSTYSFTDKTAEPGRYYEYRVIAYGDDCEGGGRVIGNSMRDVGFSRSLGVISGRVQFDDGTAVNDVRVSLSCESNVKSGQVYHSRGVLEKGDALKFTSLGEVVNDHKPFTLQMYVRPDSSNTDMTLLTAPVNLGLKYNKDKGLFDILLNKKPAGGIPAGEYSQVSLMCDGNKVNAFTAGNTRAVADTSVTAPPMYDNGTMKFDPILLNDDGSSFDGWFLSNRGESVSGWIISDNAFCSSHITLTAWKDATVSPGMIGLPVDASVSVSAEWGAKVCKVEAMMYDDAGNLLSTETICHDTSTHKDWLTYSKNFTIPPATTRIRYQITARDKDNWKGYFGPRFRNMQMKINVDLNGLLDGNNWVLCHDFIGNVDEIRLWNRVLTTDEITADVDRLISGETEGLKSYITFDEGLEEYAFDISCSNGVPNGNHVTVGANTRPDDIIPTANQLSAYGMTNDKGEYEIRAIPFTGSGTRYSVYPTKGVHTFNPTNRSAFIGGTSLTINNSDFIDESSFKVSGTVRYAGTTIPVDSVSFYVDGRPCNKNDKLIMTDANGEYEISVPIGNHYIEARRMIHVFEGGGRYPATEGETYEFLADTHIDFFDITQATVAGRVTGGETEGQKPLGYGVSENTIGAAVIKLSPLDHPQRLINAVQHIEGTTSQWIANSEKVDVASASNMIGSTAYRGAGSEDEAKCVYITTDPKTGEFSAILPPIRYKVESVKFTNNPDIDRDEMFNSIPAIDLRNPNDTIIPDTIYSVGKVPLPLFKCNRKLMLTYRSNPVIDIKQMGAPEGVFGVDTVTVRDAGKDVKLAIYNYDKTTKKVTYNYGYPVFQMGRTYNFKVKAYEPYTNYDTDKKGKLYKDVLRDSVVTFDNELGAHSIVAAIDTVAEGHQLRRGELVRLESGQVPLDSLGEGTYKWIAGIPSLTKPFTRNMNASMVINKQTRLWQKDGLTGICFGVVPTGNNFITAGPSHVQMVLRDPPGDASSATWATDTVTSDYTYTVRGIHNGTETGVEAHVSMEFAFLKGTAFFGMLDFNTTVHENFGFFKYDVNKTWDNHTSVTLTNSHATSTSSDMNYVGRDGDVFIGYSTNYIIGAADKVGLFKQDDGSWGVGVQETMAMDEKFNTHFEYSQKYIETTLFDNIKRTRNSMIKHINSMSEIEENPPVPTYYTFLTSDDKKYGSSNNDMDVWGADAKDGFDGPSYYARFPKVYEGIDSVMWCNEVIAKWKKTLADNEEDKLKAFGNAKYKIGNESFERGVSVTNTTGKSTKEVHNSVEEFKTGLAFKGRNGYLYDKLGAIIVFNTEIGYHQTIYDVDETTTTERFSYTLNDTQRGNAHSVDIFNSTRGWGPIFRTRGGQTRCPYEGETKTLYYRPGQTLDYATMRLDNPKISMPLRNIVDIPAGQEAQVQIVLANESEVHEELSPVFLYVSPESNQHGLQILMDGQPLLNGTELWLQYGVPMTKTLTIKQSDQSVLDYEDIKLVIASTCNPSVWQFGDVKFSAHFVPAAPDITLKLDKNVLNQRAVEGGEEIVATISDINRMFSGLKGVRLKYRFAGDAQWVTAHEWMVDEKYIEGGGESDNDYQSLLPSDQPNVVYNLKLPNIDGSYIVAAESICLFGSKEYTNTTPELTVVRDTRGPKLLGQAYPNTGILLPTDDIYIKFNEDIRESYLTKETNFFITGSLNDAQVSHEVSLQFNGTPVHTDAYLPVTATSFSGSLWIKRKSGGTLIEHGLEGKSLELSINDRGQVEVNIDGLKATSRETVPVDKWVFLAFNYVKGAVGGNNRLSILMAEDDNETMLFDDIEVPDYSGTGRLSFGENYTGLMHELVLWHKNTPVRTLLAQKDEAVAAYMPDLVGYWKMNEGHGTVVTDYAHSRNIHLPAETWNIENSNLAAHLDGENSSLHLPIGAIAPRPTDSYVLELWFRGEQDKNSNAVLFSITDRLAVAFDVDNSLMLHVYNDTLSSFNTSGIRTMLSSNNYNDGNWHHFALNVHRGVGAVAYVDGSAVKTIAEREIPEPSGDLLHIGSILKRMSHSETARESNCFIGDIDEIRMWNVACDGTSIIANRYNQVDTAKASGLLLYYPMEHSRLDGSGNIIHEFNLDNHAPEIKNNVMASAYSRGVIQAATAPALRTAPLKQNLDFNFTASSNEIYINLKTLPARMQGNLLTFVVKNVRDVHDNLSETITWSAVVDYNTLEWAENEGVEVYKNRLNDVNVNAVLRNKGRASQRFTITGLPTWIKTDSEKGVLDINASQMINFTIGADAPMGIHFFYINAVNDDGISTPLLFKLYVTGNEPEWSVNPDQYESSMNLTGQIYFDDKICNNSLTMIAAFIDGECRGVAYPKLVTSRDAYFVSINVYGSEDITKAQPITFSIYDASRGVVLSNVATTLNGVKMNLTYRANDIVGSFDQPLKWTASDMIEQTFDLKTGWNWISLYHEPEQGKDDLESVFGHAKVFNTIKGKEGFAMNSGTAWEQTGLSTVAPGNLYKVKVKADVAHTVTGKPIDPAQRTQTIKNGWNWIGPLSILNLSLGEAFADLNPTRGDIVKSKEQVAFYDGYKWEGELTALITGRGYYYRSMNPNDVTFHYPTLVASAQQAPALPRAPLRSIFSPVDHYQFSDNMNVVARVMVDGQPVDTLTVAAFVGNECRGVTRATPNGYYMLTIAGNASEAGGEVTFETIYKGKVVNINEKLTWGSDVVYGDLDEPVILTIQKSSGIDDVDAYSDRILITPTLVRDMLNVRAGALLQSLAVYTVNGSCLMRLTDIGDNRASLNLGDLDQGVYLVEAISATGTRVTKRIVKQ